jgi:uncharacterized protein
MYGRDDAINAFNDFIRDAGFPCVGAKSALAMDAIRIFVARDLRDHRSDVAVLAFLDAPLPSSVGLASTVVLFPETPLMTEVDFEGALWQRLQAVHDIDCHKSVWDAHVSDDPQSADFGMSLGGIGYFIVGLHPGASRIARRAPMAMLAFNPHSQFRQLKSVGKYQRVQKIVQARDMAIQGSVNPMLAEHGAMSEAAQYSGRAVGSDWLCPFKPNATARSKRMLQRAN